MSAIVGGLRVLSAGFLFLLAVIVAIVAANYDQSYDSAQGLDVIVTGFLSIVAVGLGAGGLAFLPLRRERFQTAMAGLALAAFAIVAFVALLLFV